MNFIRSQVAKANERPVSDFGCEPVQSYEAVNAPQPLDLTRYRDALLGHIRSIVKDSAEAEDVLQEVFERAHHNVEQLRAEAALTTWLFRISTHVSVDHLRKRERRPLVVEPFDLDDLCPDEPEPSLQALVEQREMSACVQRFILDLQIDYRTVILLHDVEGLTAAEIALVLDLTLANVKMRLHRARASLKAALELGCEFSCDCRGVTVCEPKTK